MGKQITAARALVGWTRAELAKAAGIHSNAVAYWERAARIPRGSPGRRVCTSEPFGVARMRKALEDAGICFLEKPAPGVTLCAKDNFLTYTRAREPQAG